MEYFTQKELDFFATLKKQPYKNSNPERQKIGNDLRSTSVYVYNGIDGPRISEHCGPVISGINGPLSFYNYK